MPCLKKKDKSSEQLNSDASAGDALDLTPFQDEIASINEQLSKDLSALKPGGLFDPMLIQGLRVPLGKTDQAEGDKKGREKGKAKSAPQEAVRVSDLAQVVPRGGRMVLVIVGDEKVHLCRHSWLC